MPYGLTEDDIKTAVLQVERYFVKINDIVAAEGLPLLHQILAPNVVSGLVSELMVYNIGTRCQGLVKNCNAGGFPDLLPITEYANNSVQRGLSGIEVKASKNSTWHGHNSEEGWFLAIKYLLLPDTNTVKIDKVHLANLSNDDWTFCPRKENSRRTPTASINKNGLKKLRSFIVYKNGDQYGMERRLEQVGQNEIYTAEDFSGSNLDS